MHREEVKDPALQTIHRSNLGLTAAISAFVLLALSSVAGAQPDVTCKPTETQPECHARLKCKPYEELEDCQKRLKAAGSQGNQNNNNNNANNQNRDNNNDRGDRDNGDNDRGDRDNDRGDDRDNGRRSRGDGRPAPRGRGRGNHRRGGNKTSRGFETNKTFGLGLELGEPTGLNGKYFLSDAGALDFGVGWIYQHYYYGDGVNLYADYLFHPASLVSAEAFELPFYIGIGLRYWSFDYCDVNPDICYRGSSIGVRIPVGISFDFNNAPLDIFLQLVPVIDFASGDYYDRYRDRSHVGIDFSAGIRFWFK
jgi:hypothetical protein